MKTFTVKRIVDAFVIYEADVEAESAEQAAQLAYRNEDNYAWGDGDPVTYDARSFVTLDDDGKEIASTKRGDL